MVVGLERFRNHFAAFTDQYVLIGGTACAMLMQKSGLDFRSTKDLDIVLYVEALGKPFVTAFWQFVKEGRYSNQQRSTGKEIFYRFTSPSIADFPFMLELFSRKPDTVTLFGESHITPIPVHETITSLSAILLNDDYYRFIHSGKTEVEGLPVLEAGYLIPLKARAYIDLEDRKNNGTVIDERDIRKHRNDIIRLCQLLSPNDRIELSAPIRTDVRLFLERVKKEPSIDCGNLGLRHMDIGHIVEMLKWIYSVNEEAE